MKKLKTLMFVAVLFAAVGLVACGGDDEPINNQQEEPTPDPKPTPDPDPVPTPDPEPVGPYFPTGDNAYKDTTLEIEFESVPTLGTSGLIKIFKADGTQVDYIDMADVAAARVRMEKNQTITTAMNVIGNRQVKRYRVVHYDAVKVVGNRVVITPHYDVLDYGATYYVTIDNGVIVADDFEGIADNQTWQFKVKSAPTSATVRVGGKNADFKTIQAALDYGYDCGKDAAVTIEVAEGVYEEQLFIRYNNNLTIKGMGATRDDVVLHYANCDLLNSGVGGSISQEGNLYKRPKAGDVMSNCGGRTVVLIESCDNIRFENMTLENSYYKTTTQNSQAEVVYNNDNNGDCGVMFIGCNILSRQDTLNLKGYCWFYDCLVAGDVDFIWGGATAALFEKCEIRSVTSGGYILQARVDQSKGYRAGFIFIDCDITKADGVAAGTTWLAREGDANEDNITFIDCHMADHIAAGGWKSGTYHPTTMDAQHGLKEHNSMDMSGNAIDLTKRNKPSYILTDEDVATYYKDRATIFAAYSKSAVWQE